MDTWASNVQIKPETYYNLLLAVNGTTATLMLDNKKLFSYIFAPRVVDGYAFDLNKGMVGVGSDNSRGVFDNITVPEAEAAGHLPGTRTTSGTARPTCSPGRRPGRGR